MAKFTHCSECGSRFHEPQIIAVPEVLRVLCARCWRALEDEQGD